MSLRERTLNAVRKSFLPLASCACKPRKSNNHKMQQQGAMRKRKTEKEIALFVLFWIREFRRVPPTFPQKWRHHIVRCSKNGKNNICWTNYRFVSFRQLTLICTARKKAFYFEEGGGTKNPMIDAGFHTGPSFFLSPRRRRPQRRGFNDPWGGIFFCSPRFLKDMGKYVCGKAEFSPPRDKKLGHLFNFATGEALFFKGHRYHDIFLFKAPF